MTLRSGLSAGKQTAVWWGNPVPTGGGGRTFDAPIEITVRWQEKQELFVDAVGRTLTSSAVVYPARDLPAGGYLYLGILDDLPSNPVDPETITEAREIRGSGWSTSVANSLTVWKVWL